MPDRDSHHAVRRGFPCCALAAPPFSEARNRPAASSAGVPPVLGLSRWWPHRPAPSPMASPPGRATLRQPDAGGQVVRASFTPAGPRGHCREQRRGDHGPGRRQGAPTSPSPLRGQDEPGRLAAPIHTGRNRSTADSRPTTCVPSAGAGRTARILGWVVDLRCRRQAGHGDGWLGGCCSRSSTC